MHINRRRLIPFALILVVAGIIAVVRSGDGDADVIVDPEPVRGSHVYDGNQGGEGGGGGSARDSVGEATALLSGVAFTTYASGSVTDTSGDTTAHLCPGGRFAYVSNFVSTYVEGADSSSYDHPYGESRTEGSWQVTSAQIGPDGQSGTALVSYVGDDGSSGEVQIEIGPGGATVNGQPAEVGSAAC
jgi:hypothetical protein